MSSSVLIPSGASKDEIYEALLGQVEALLAGETNLIARCANFVALLKETFRPFWVGFYFVDSPQQLVVGPYQGPLACMRIGYGRGVCGTAWKEDRTVVVPDVTLFSDHIACSALSRSEIVLPFRRAGAVVGVLDTDSCELNTFDECDTHYLEKLLLLL